MGAAPSAIMTAANQTTGDVFKGMMYAARNNVTEKSRRIGLAWQPGPEDIILVTTPKSGTAWMLQILQTLRSHGDMSFEDINITQPMIEAADDYGMDLAAPQKYSPRCFWTHFWYESVPKGAGKYIYVIRDPIDIGPSLFYYLQGWFFEVGEITKQQFLEDFFLALGLSDPADDAMWYNTSIWHHFMSWYPHRADPNVLWLHYEDLHDDRAACIKLISEFLQLGHADPELQALALQQSDISFMKQYPEKYDDHHGKESRNLTMGLSLAAGMDKPGRVREGKVGGNKDLPPRLVEAFKKKWQEVVLPQTGFASYQEMRHAINKELGRPFKPAL